MWTQCCACLSESPALRKGPTAESQPHGFAWKSEEPVKRGRECLVILELHFFQEVHGLHVHKHTLYFADTLKKKIPLATNQLSFIKC